MKKSLVLAVSAMLIFAGPAYAAGEYPSIVSGTLGLLSAVMKWLLAIIPVGAACSIGWHAMAKQMNESDPTRVAVHNQAMKNTLIGAAIGMTATGTVAAVLSFFQ